MISGLPNPLLYSSEVWPCLCDIRTTSRIQTKKEVEGTMEALSGEWMITNNTKQVMSLEPMFDKGTCFHHGTNWFPYLSVYMCSARSPVISEGEEGGEERQV